MIKNITFRSQFFQKKIIFLLLFSSISLSPQTLAAPNKIKLPKSLPSKYAGTWERLTWYEGIYSLDKLIEEGKSYYFNPNNTYREGNIVYLQLLTRAFDETHKGGFDYGISDNIFDCNNGQSDFQNNAFTLYDKENIENNGRPTSLPSPPDPYFAKFIYINKEPVWFIVVPPNELSPLSFSPTRVGSYGRATVIEACKNIN